MEQWFIEGIVYKYSLGASGAPAVDLLTVASVDLYSSSTDHNIVMTELSGDRVKREYSVKEIVFTSYEYGEYWINGKIAGISYSASAGTSMVPEFGLTVGKTEIEMSNAYTKVGFMTNGISVSLTASAGESGSHRIVLAATGDIGWSIETSGYMSAFSASLKDFNATVVSTSDRSTWDVTASQKEAVVYYASSDVGEGIIMSFDGSGDKFSGSMKISQGKAVITGLYNHDDVLSV